MNHTFNVSIAESYGLEEAILLENIVWWCRKNYSNNQHIKNGLAWTYNSILAFSQLFTYMSVSKIRRALQHLEDEGLLVTAIGKNTMDRSKWYAATKKAYDLLGIQFCEVETNEKELTKEKTSNIKDNESSFVQIEVYSQEKSNKEAKAIEVQNDKSIYQNKQKHLIKQASAFDKNDKSICQNEQMHLTKQASAFSQNEQVLLNNSYNPDINSNYNPNINTNINPNTENLDINALFGLYNIWKSAGLPCNNENSIVKKDLSLLVSTTKELSLPTLREAIKNYISVIELMPNKTWWTTLYTLSDFVKPEKIQRFLPGCFRIEAFREKGKKGCAVNENSVKHVEVTF